MARWKKATSEETINKIIIRISLYHVESCGQFRIHNSAFIDEFLEWKYLTIYESKLFVYRDIFYESKWIQLLRWASKMMLHAYWLQASFYILRFSSSRYHFETPTEPTILRPLSLMDRKFSNSHTNAESSLLKSCQAYFFSSKIYYCLSKIFILRILFLREKNDTFQWIWILQERLWVQWMCKNSPAAFFNFQQQRYSMKLNYNHPFLVNSKAYPLHQR